MARKRREGIRVIKGAGTPLTPAQRELVAIFVAHLQRLTPLKDWLSDEYLIVNRLLGNHFQSLNPSWVNTLAKKRSIDELPDEGAKFTYLMENAANPEDPAIVRKRQMALLRQLRSAAETTFEVYDSERVKAGLQPERLFTVNAATPIDRMVAATYAENHIAER